IAAPFLAALHRLEQVGVRTFRQLEVDGKRRVEVGEDLARDGDAVEALKGQFSEAISGHGDTCNRKTARLTDKGWLQPRHRRDALRSRVVAVFTMVEMFSRIDPVAGSG